jgi:hypothetical protein
VVNSTVKREGEDGRIAADVNTANLAREAAICLAAARLLKKKYAVSGCVV